VGVPSTFAGIFARSEEWPSELERSDENQDAARTRAPPLLPLRPRSRFSWSSEAEEADRARRELLLFSCGYEAGAFPSAGKGRSRDAAPAGGPFLWAAVGPDPETGGSGVLRTSGVL